jgi:transposase-like protein
MKSKTTYSAEFKEQALVKVYNRGDRTIQDIADELNINLFTLKNGMKTTTPNTEKRTPDKAKRPQDWRPEDRLVALHECYGLSDEALNAWCRARGLFAHQLTQWKTDFCISGSSSREEAQALRSLKTENQRLERELTRKEKALAEAAVLLVLQKKFQALPSTGLRTGLGGEVE